MMSEHICVSLVPLFNHLDMKDQKVINTLARHKDVTKGERIFSPGDEKLVIVASGNMKVYQLSVNGKEQLLRVVEPGGYEGENQLFGATNDSVFGEALENMEICFINKEDFRKLLLEYPQLTLKLLEINAQKSLVLEQQARFLSMEKVEERLATYLLDVTKVVGTTKYTLPLKMKELATFLGTTPETLSRKFKQLESKMYLRRQQKQVEILDREGLERIISNMR
ncbi:Crp/Fnr family transcriptional regulator [Erysipelotrichaceae bacterium MTC7]|nr:Crp/Fnr family transcriptional regulator [Erysipelotrichaceae bacterium MTC7]